MADPSQAERATWIAAPVASIQVIATWAGVDPPLLTSVCDFFEAQPGEPYKAFALLTAEDEEAFMNDGVRDDGRPWGRLSKAKVTLMLRACRVAAELQPTAASVLEVERAQAIATTSSTTLAATTSPPASSTEDVPFNGVILQGARRHASGSATKMSPRTLTSMRRTMATTRKGRLNRPLSN